MIATNSKFAIKEHPTSARIFGEVNLDFVRVSHEKNKFMVDSDEYEIAEAACRNSDIFKQISSAARKNMADSVNKKENVVVEKHIEASMPMLTQAIKDLEQDFPTSNINISGKGFGKNKKGGLLGSILNLNKKSRGGYNKSGNQPNNPNPNPSSSNGELRGEMIEIHNQTFEIKREFINDKGVGRKDFTFEDGILTILLNNAYAGYKNTKDKNSYCLETLQEAIVEFLHEDNEAVISKINECKEKLVTATSKLANAFGDDLLS